MANSKNKPKGFNLAGSNKKYGFRTVPNDSVPWRLQSADGKYFGDISYDAYKAVEGGTLDSYKAKTEEEKNIITEYRKYPGIALKSQDGTEFGKISYDAYKAFTDNAIEGYTPHSDAENKAISDFKAYAESKAKEERINSNPTFARYNIDPADFDSMDDLRAWGDKRKIYFGVVAGSSSDMQVIPEYEKTGFMGIGAKTYASKQEIDDANVLLKHVQNAERAGDSQKDKGGFAAFLSSAAQNAFFGMPKALGDYAVKHEYEKAGLDPDMFVSPSQSWVTTQGEHKIANISGDIAGSIATLGLLGKGVGAATKGVKWISKSPLWVQNAINSGITFAVAGGAETAFDGGDLKDVLVNTGTNFVGGAVGGALSSKVGSIGEKILFNKGLQHKIIPEMIRNGFSSAAFAGGKVASTYFLYPEEYRPTAEEMAKDIGVAFAFGAVSSGINTVKTSAQNKKYLDDLYQKMASDYENMAKANISGKSDISGIRKFAKNVVGYSNAMEAYLTGKEFNATIDGNTYTFTPNKIRLVGQDSYVNSILTELQTIRNNANAVLSGVGTPEAGLTTTTPASSGATTPGVAPTLPGGSAPMRDTSTPVPPVVSAPVTNAPATDAQPAAPVTPAVDASSPVTSAPASGELGEIMGAGEITKFTPKSANGEIKRLENILIAKGADDVSRQEIIGAALEIEKALVGSDKTIRSVFNNVSKITSGAVTEIKNKAGVSGAYWKLFGENFKAMPSGSVTDNVELITEYATAYTEALKSGNPEKYNAAVVSADGKDLSAELPQTIMQNVIPADTQNAGEYRLVATQIKNIISDVDVQLASERAEIYGDETSTVESSVAKADAVEPVSEDTKPNTVKFTLNGDFYNVYGADAELITEKLGIKNSPTELNGKTVPYIGVSPDVLRVVTQELSKLGITVSVNTETPTVTSTNEQNMPVSNENTPVNEDVTNIDVDMAEGEILSLKHTKNVYSLFKGAMRVVVGKDIITDGFVVLPLTDESLAGVKKVIGDSAPIQENPNFEMKKFYHADNDVIIQGNPKLGEAPVNNKTIKAYTFKIGDAFYSCQQKFIDAFNNGKSVIKANKSNNIPWTVHNENGDLVALFLGLRANVTEQSYNQMQSVAEIKATEQQKKAENANKPFNQNEVRVLIEDGRPFFSVVHGINYVGDGHIFTACDEAAADFIKAEYRKQNANSNYEIEHKEGFGGMVEKLLAEAKELAEANNPISYSGADTLGRAANAYIVGDYAILFNKKYADLIKKRSKSMKIISSGKLGTTILVGYDADGKITGFALPILVKGEVTTKVGKTVPFVTESDLKNLVTVDAESGIKSDKNVTKPPESVTEPTESVIKKAESVTETPESEKITVGMSDDTRAELLNKKSVNVVLSAVEKTIKPEIVSNSNLMEMLTNKFGGNGITGIVDEIIARYSKENSIGEFENLFIDAGEEIYSALQNQQSDNVNYSVDSEIDSNADLHSDADSDIIDADYILSERGEVNETTGNNGRRTGEVFAGFGNQRGRDSGDTGDLSVGDAALDNEGLDRIKSQEWDSSEGGSKKYLDTTAYGTEGEDATSRKEADGRRFLEAVKSGNEVTARKLLDRQAERNGYVPAHVYYGTSADYVFTEFNNDSAIWVSTDERYARRNAEDNFSYIKSYLYTEEDSAVYDLYVKHGKVLDLGNINEELRTPEDVINFGKEIGFSKSEILKCWNSGRRYESNKKWALSVTPEFAEIAREHGYDSLRAIEAGGVETYGILYPENVKSAKTVTYDENGEIVPLEDRFNTSTSDSRYLIEGENVNEQTRSILSDGSGKRRNGTSAQKSTQKVDGRSRRYRERRSAAYKRRELCKTLRDTGNTETKIIHGHKCEVIPEAHYDKHMSRVVKRAKSAGIDNVVLITGQAKLPFVKDKNGNPKTARGVIIENNGKKTIIVQYDHEIHMPEKIIDHELVHDKYETKRTQKAKNIIKNSLSVGERQRILENLSKDYNGIIKGKEEKLFEEFVANVLSGMSSYSYADAFRNLATAYWNGDDAFIDNYKVSEYTESTDAGGNELVSDFADSLQLSEQEYAMVSRAIMAKNAGLTDNELKPVDYVYATDEFYVYKNHSIGDFTLVNRFEHTTDAEEINYLREMIDDGAYAGRQRFNKWTAGVRGRARSNPRYSRRVENSGAKRTDDRFPAEQSEGNSVGYSSKNGGNSEGKVNYSFDKVDSDAEFWEEWFNKAKEYGAIPKGENPTRDIDVPQKITKDKLVSQFARTMLEAGVTPDTAVSEFEKRVLDGTMTHEVVTNNSAREWAVNQIKYHGFEEALNTWGVYTRDGNVGKKELALGMELYNQCITSGDVTNAMKIAAELVAEATHAGQTLQATRMLKLMTPDGQLYYLEKSIQKMNDEFKKKIGDKYEDIELNEELMEKFLTEKEADKRDEIYDEICQDIADQIPPTLLDKWNSWRYLAMLGNPRTHIRNIAGNAVFTPAIKLKNYIGAVIEKVAKVDTDKRTKSLHKNKKAVEFAKNDFAKMLKVLQGENAKYAVTSDIEGKRTIFKTKWLEKLRTKNFEWLEKEDMWFLKMHYVDALAQIITARKLDVNNIDEKTLDIARAYAVREAQRATYRDANSIAEALNKLQKKASHSEKKAVRAANVLLEGVMPFKKTPLNIAKQGVQYSPVGILTGVYKTVSKIKDGDAYSTTDIIDDFAKGFTGTALMLLGTLLASLGMISGGDDENKKKKEFDKMVGEQSFSINIGDKSYTIDWMAPTCLPLFTGVELYELTKDDFKFADITAALSSLTDPLLELSVFSGISGAIESAQYNDTNTLFAIGSDMTTSYLTQALPTVGGQLSRIVDKNKREYYYADKNSNLPKGVQNFIGQVSSKIPFASYLFEPSIDEWGREETYGGILERTLENVVSPGYYSEKNYTEVDEEIKRLYESTGDADVLPVIQQKKYTESKIDYPMTATQYTEAKKLRGQKSFELIEQLLSNRISVKLQNKQTGKYQAKLYSQMSDEEKIRAIKRCYENAGDYTKEIMLEEVKDSH